MRVLIVSNLDSRSPFGQYLRPFHLGRGLAALGADVTHVGVDCSGLGHGDSFSTSEKSLRRYVGAARLAIRRSRPHVVYGHEVRGGIAALLAARDLPVVVDFHSLPSLEWLGYARTQEGRRRAVFAAAAARSYAGERTMARRADGIIAAGREVADDVMRMHTPRRRPTVVTNGVPDALLERGDGPAATAGGAAARIAVAAVPGAQSEANVRALGFLHAVAGALARRDAGIAIHVLGSEDGPGAPGIVYRGFLDDAAYAETIARAAVCLLPYPREAALAGGPRNKLLEYLAAGRTIVTTDEGLRGLRHVADWPGVTVTSDEPADFAAAMVRAASADAQGLDAARQRVRSELRWDLLAARVHAELQTAADGR